jgi:hypothetical protein
MNDYYVRVWSQALGWQIVLPPGSTYQQVVSYLQDSVASSAQVYRRMSGGTPTPCPPGFYRLGNQCHPIGRWTALPAGGLAPDGSQPLQSTYQLVGSGSAAQALAQAQQQLLGAPPGGPSRVVQFASVSPLPLEYGDYPTYGRYPW